jgi:hypothetical protein
MSRTRRSRRQFLSTATAAAAGAVILGAPTILTASKTESRLVVGEGEHKFEVYHDWPQLPKEFTWQTTHNVAVDKTGNLYVIHEGIRELKDHPSIFVALQDLRQDDAEGGNRVAKICPDGIGRVRQG